MEQANKHSIIWKQKFNRKYFEQINVIIRFTKA